MQQQNISLQKIVSTHHSFTVHYVLQYTNWFFVFIFYEGLFHNTFLTVFSLVFVVAKLNHLQNTFEFDSEITLLHKMRSREIQRSEETGKIRKTLWIDFRTNFWKCKKLN